MSRYTRADFEGLKRSSTKSPLRAIALIDYDAFYAQCEIVRLGLDPSTPLAVRQWNAIIALNYAAKAAGIRRGNTVDEARKACPDVVIQHVATWREGEETWAYHDNIEDYIGIDKSALDPYRLESEKSMKLIQNFLPKTPAVKIEMASIDEVFIDLSPLVHHVLVGCYKGLSQLDGLDQSDHLPMPDNGPLDWADDVLYPESSDHQTEPIDWDEVVLNTASEMIRLIRQQILLCLNYTCSAGIARNKTTAKLGAGFAKPNRQTVISAGCEKKFLQQFKINKIRKLGGKHGREIVSSFGTESVAELAELPTARLECALGKELGAWVYAVLQGIDESEVVERRARKSMLTQKMFVPSLERHQQAYKWLKVFVLDLLARLDVRREQFGDFRPRTLTLRLYIRPRSVPFRAKQVQIPSTGPVNKECLLRLGKTLLDRYGREPDCWPCVTLSMGISDFSECSGVSPGIGSYFIDSNTTRTLAHSDMPVLQLGLDSHEGRQQILEDYPCPSCQKDIPASVVLEHVDWHAAKDLSAQDVADT